MDDYLFQFHVEKSKYVLENTRYLEIYTYSNSLYDTVVEHSLPLDQFDDFLSEKEAFARPKLPDGVTQVAGFRMILQQNASHPETFSPSVISLPPDKYSKMMTKFNLPYKGIEGSSMVGPLFSTGYDEALQTLQMIYRKADVKEKGATRGWELLSSYNIDTGVTKAFCKGTSKSYIVDCVKHLKASSTQIRHPMLFPIIIFSHYHSARIEIRQRDARERLRKVERALSFTQNGSVGGIWDSYVDEHGLIDFDRINRELTECHCQVLKKSPFAYLRVLDGFDEAMTLLAKTHESDTRWAYLLHDTHSKLSSRIDFYRKKLHGQEYYQSITLQRLEVQRSALTMSCGQIDNRVSYQIAEAQTKLAHSSRREAVSQKVIAILGTVFLPGAYLSSLFSMTFFNWQSTNSNSLYVSPLFWVYWAVSIPLTVAVVGSYILWDRKLSMKAHKEDEEIELRMLDMKKKSQNQTVKSGTAVNSRSGSVQKI